MAAPTKIKMTPTSLNHIFLIDWNDDGLMHEIAVVKLFDDGAIAGILVDGLHAIDKARIKKVVTSPYAEKYPLYELLSHARFSNGVNGLDYVHSNFVKIKRPKGSRASVQSISTISTALADTNMIGSDYSNPSEVGLDQSTKQFSY
jgi:hypothetical protein